ncbi:hypothetical protein J6590_066569 [Homalodisca vitripennis]|nr:hypothetical protein J6590_066569 [Homalodisca vitripennis]
MSERYYTWRHTATSSYFNPEPLATVGESGVKPGGRVQTRYLTFGLASAATYRLMPELRSVVQGEAEDASPCFFNVLYSCYV